VFILFVCGATLHKIRSVATQLHKRHLLLLLFCAAQEVAKKKATVVAVAFFFILWRAAAALPRSSMLWSYYSTATQLPAAELRYSADPCCGAAAAQLHEEGDGSCRHLLLPAMEVRCSAPPRRRRRQLSSPSSACFGAALQRNSTKKALPSFACCGAALQRSKRKRFCCGAFSSIFLAFVAYGVVP
jgi:hypothetical protein